MKRLLCLFPIVLFASQPLQAQSGFDLYQQALQKERVEGNLEAAIELYEDIVEKHASNSALASKALLQIARSFERLGQTAEARRVYDRLLDSYPDEAQAIELGMAKPTSVSVDGSGIILRRLSVEPEGHYVLYPGDVGPNGRRIVFTDFDTGRLVVRDLASGERLDFSGSYPELAQWPVFSPDGRRIAYSWVNSAQPDAAPEIRIVDIRGGDPITLYRNEAIDFVHPADWSADGAFITALIYLKDRTRRLATIRLRDGVVQEVKSFDWRTPQRITISPDGRYVAYDFPPDETKPQRDIYVLALDGSAEWNVTRSPDDDHTPTWSPIGDAVFFFSDRGDYTGLWKVGVREPEEVAPSPVKRGLRDTSPLGFDRSGRFLYALYTGTDARYSAAIDWESLEVTAEPTLTSLPARGSWSPDGRLIARVPETAPLQKERRVLLRDIETGSERFIVTELARIAGRVAWSPDGRRLLVHGTDVKGRSGIFVVDIRDGSAESVAFSRPGEFWMMNATWSRDGKEIFFQRSYDARPEGKEIVARELSSGEERILFRAGSIDAASLYPDFQLSPDGRLLAFRTATADDTWPIMIVNLEDGSRRKVIDMRDYRLRGWTPDGEHLIVVKSIETSQASEHGWDVDRKLWFVSVENGSVDEVDVGLDSIVSARPHPDGKRLLLGVFEDGAEIWAMENILATESK